MGYYWVRMGESELEIWVAFCKNEGKALLFSATCINFAMNIGIINQLKI